MSVHTGRQAEQDVMALASLDSKHRSLGMVLPRWFQRSGLVCLSWRDVDGTPLVACALRRESCPIDAMATVRIKYWLANRTVSADKLRTALVENIRHINTIMATQNEGRVWGLVPKDSAHLLRLLEPLAERGACQRIDGASVPLEDDSEGYRYFWVFVGERQQVTDAV